MTSIAAAWREGRTQARQRRATLTILVTVLAILARLAGRVPLAAVGAAGCFVAAGWTLGTVAGLIASSVALLFLEWRMTN